MKNKEIVSEIVNDLRANQIDDRVSERYILSKLKDFNSLFLKRENDAFRLFYMDNMWLTIDCIELEEVDYSLCTDVRIPKVTSYMRSKLPIPEFYTYKNGPLIKGLMTMDEGNVYIHTTQPDFRKAMNREYTASSRYFYLRNNYLILPNSTAKRVSLEGAFKNPHEARQLSVCTAPDCIDPMEEEFPCPAHLVGIVKQETIKDLFNFYKRNILDEVPDSDLNKKTDN